MSQESVWKLSDALRDQGGHVSPDVLAVNATLHGLRLDTPGALEWYPMLLRLLGHGAGPLHVPELAGRAMVQLIGDDRYRTVLDPSAGVGALLGSVLSALAGAKGHALTQMPQETVLGRALLPDCEWHVGDPIDTLSGLSFAPDLVVCIPPFGIRLGRPIDVNGVSISANPELGEAILLRSIERMGPDGLGLFVMPASFMFRQNSVRHRLPELGWGIEAAFELPSGAFRPYAGVHTSLVVIRKRPMERMFVGQLSNDEATTKAVIDNYQANREGGSLELGRFVDPAAFRGIAALQAEDELRAITERYGTGPNALGELAIEVNLGRSGEDFRFPEADNAIYVPLIGTSDVVDSAESLKLKPQNYAQVIVDPTKSRSAFVAQYLNSEQGRSARSGLQAGVIPKLNRSTLGFVQVHVPALSAQEAMMELEARLTAEQNVILGLQAEIADIRRTAWADPRTLDAARGKLEKVSKRLSVGLKEYTSQSLEAWYETLPFPLASILRAWQASPPQDHRTKHDHLQHFFEATAEFLSVVLLSAFSSNTQFFEAHKQRLQSGLAKQHLSFERATFGTWKTVIDYLGKQLRQLLNEDGKKAEQAKEDRDLCEALFADRTLAVPRILGKEELAAVIVRTNKYRNDWKGHGGVLGNEEAAMRNELLLTELQLLREALEGLWDKCQIIRGYQGAFRRGVFENEIAILKGSNSEFLKETRVLGTPLDVERLYILAEGNTTALKLLPLVHIGATPSSARNACYFFNRLERSGVRFVSYHYVDLPELTEAFEEAKATIQFLTKID